MKDMYLVADVSSIYRERCVEIYTHLYDTPGVSFFTGEGFDQEVPLLYVEIEALKKSSKLKVVCETRQGMDREFRDFIGMVIDTLPNESDLVDQMFLKIERVRQVRGKRSLTINGEEK